MFWKQPGPRGCAVLQSPARPHMAPCSPTRPHTAPHSPRWPHMEPGDGSCLWLLAFASLQLFSLLTTGTGWDAACSGSGTSKGEQSLGSTHLAMAYFTEPNPKSQKPALKAALPTGSKLEEHFNLCTLQISSLVTVP